MFGFSYHTVFFQIAQSRSTEIISHGGGGGLQVKSQAFPVKPQGAGLRNSSTRHPKWLLVGNQYKDSGLSAKIISPCWFPHVPFFAGRIRRGDVVISSNFTSKYKINVTF